MKMGTKQLKDAIMVLLRQELPRGRFSIDELGEKIEVLFVRFSSKSGKKDKNAPKKTKTAYNFFCQSNRAEVIKGMDEGSDEKVKFVDVVRALAEKWKVLKQRCDIADEDATTEMNEYKAQSVKDMGRFLEEKTAYESR